MAKVRGNAHPLDASMFVFHAEIVATHIEIQRNGGTLPILCEGIALDSQRRQHGDLVARHIDGRKARARDLVHFGSGSETQARCGNVDADAPEPIPERRHGKGVVDFGRGGVIKAECRNVGQLEIGRIVYLETGCKTHTSREAFEQKPVQMVVV